MLKESPVVSQWLSQIEKIHTKTVDLGLDRILEVAKKLNLNTFNCPTILIGGTNGKGSSVRLLESIYQEAGYKTGAFSSPHLHRFNERIRINANDIDDTCLCDAFEFIENHRGNIPLTYFEFTTLAGLYIFKNQELDVIILEVGLGGRLDAMNIVDADVAIITSIDIDHTEYLGDTREGIGFEKAGIFRQGKLALCGDPNPPQSIINHAKNIGADFYHTHNFLATRPIAHNFELNLPSVLKTIELLHPKLPLEAESITRALEKINLSGRFEQIQRVCPIILDIAHNPAACVKLANAIKKLPCQGKCYALVSLLSDKDLANSIKPFVELIDEWHSAEVQHSRSRKIEDLRDQITAISKRQCYTHASIALGLEEILKKAKESDRILVFGSFFTVAEAREFLLKE